MAVQVSGILARQFTEHGIDARFAPLYAQMLVGIVAMPAQWWLLDRTMTKEEVAAHMVTWRGTAFAAWSLTLYCVTKETLHDPTCRPS